jgi:hypothetical protein
LKGKGLKKEKKKVRGIFGGQKIQIGGHLKELPSNKCTAH